MSACRNLDVTLTLLEEKLDSASAGTTRDAWDCVRKHTLKLRAKEFVRARKQLRRMDINDFIQKTQRLLRAGKAENGLGSNFRQSLDQSLVQWHETLDQAKNKRDPECLHSLRLAGKRLRYRWELLAELGEGDAKSRIKSLKALQDKLGVWHDRHVLSQFLEEFIGRPNFPRDHPDLYRALELEMESERRDNDAAIDGILKQAEEFRVRQTQPVTVEGNRQKQ
ncbi:MAG: CHAD domain-containing protein [Candidatus Binatia bacterium]